MSRLPAAPVLNPVLNPLLNVVVVEDDALIVSVLSSLLHDHRVQMFATLESCLRAPTAAADLILLDLCNAQDPNGQKAVSLIPSLVALYPGVEIVVQSGVEDIDMMRACIQNGASQFVLKSDLENEIPFLLARQSEWARWRARIAASLWGDSPPMRQLRERVIAYRLRSRADVLLVGESGTGKELCAQALHGDGPFIAVNAAAIPTELFEAEFFGTEKGAYTGAGQAREGLFGAANQGTLFLDEVQSLDLGLQAKLLRVIETRRYLRVGSSSEQIFGGRMICAANVDLTELVARGQFREDLYYRIAALKIEIPPLRARRSDILPLFTKFLAESVGAKSLPKVEDDAEAFLAREYDWPGNVRELRSLCRALAVDLKIPRIGRAELEAILGDGGQLETSRELSDTFKFDPKLSFDQNVEAFEKYALLQALTKQSPAQARESLGLTRSRFYEKIRKFGLVKK